MQIINTIVIPIIRHEFLPKMLESLYKYTPPNFRVIVIDQTTDTRAQTTCANKVHLWIKSYRNLGFSKAMNIGIRLAQTPYITLANDDLQFMDSRWWQGIMDTFEMDEKIIAVNPMSPREGAWGYGLTQANKDTWVPKEGFIRDPDDPESVIPVINGKPFGHQYNYTEDEYASLLENHPCWERDTLCDGIAMWCTVFKKEGLEEVGLLDERFYPGSGEDYDMLGRAYSCAWPESREDCEPRYHRRMVGTTKSWVWHHWGKSKEKVGSIDLEMSREQWNHINLLWPNGFDSWGHKNENNKKTPFKRISEVFIDEL